MFWKDSQEAEPRARQDYVQIQKTPKSERPMDRTIQEALRLVGNAFATPREVNLSGNASWTLQDQLFSGSGKSARKSFKPHSHSKRATKPTDATNGTLVVLDGQNIGLAFDRNTGHNCFDAEGILIVLDYYLDRGVQAVALLPRNMLKSKVDKCGKKMILTALEEKNSDILKALGKEKRVAFTESKNRNAFYIMRYAMLAKADIISNDSKLVRTIDSHFTSCK